MSQTAEAAKNPFSLQVAAAAAAIYAASGISQVQAEGTVVAAWQPALGEGASASATSTGKCLVILRQAAIFASNSPLFKSKAWFGRPDSTCAGES